MAAYRTGLGPQQVAIQSLAYFVGSVLLHSAACVINDICDREFDRQVGEAPIYPCSSRAVADVSCRAVQEPAHCVWRRLGLRCHGLPPRPGRRLPLDVGVHKQPGHHRRSYRPLPLPHPVPPHEALHQLAPGLAR